MSHASPSTRRQFLIGAGTAIALPFLASMFPRAAFAGDPSETAPPPRRMLFLEVPLGFAPKDRWKKMGLDLQNDGWMPDTDGAAYAMPDVHSSLQPFRGDITFIKGIRNRRYRADSHYAGDAFLTSADTLADPSKKYCNTVSCDQVAAECEHLGGPVRYRSLTLGIAYVNSNTSTTGGLSWTRQGIGITPQTSPARVFDQLFGADDLPPELRLLRMQEKRSVLDTTLKQYQRMARDLDAADRRKLDEVASAVREVEASIQREQEWMAKPKPQPPYAAPRIEAPLRGIDPSHSYAAAKAMFDLIHAAFVTDSTRVITYEIPGLFYDQFPKGGQKHLGLCHGLGLEAGKAHVGMDRAQSDLLAKLLGRLKESREHDGQPLLHHTIGAYGAASWGTMHNTHNLPIMLFGRGGGKLVQGACRSYPDTVPLANVWLTLLEAGGVPVDSFADSTGVIGELMA